MGSMLHPARLSGLANMKPSEAATVPSLWNVIRTGNDPTAPRSVVHAHDPMGCMGMCQALFSSPAAFDDAKVTATIPASSTVTPAARAVPFVGSTPTHDFSFSRQASCNVFLQLGKDGFKRLSPDMAADHWIKLIQPIGR